MASLRKDPHLALVQSLAGLSQFKRVERLVGLAFLHEPTAPALRQYGLGQKRETRASGFLSGKGSKKNRPAPFLLGIHCR